MIVSSDQMRVLAEDVRRRFELRSMAMLRQSFPRSTERHPDDTLRLFVRHGIERARLARLETVADVERWLRLMMRLGLRYRPRRRMRRGAWRVGRTRSANRRRQAGQVS